jgi:hypothetical protein
MFNNIFENVRSFGLRYFPERQIYLRSSGEVSYHTLSTRLQVCAASGFALMASVCLFALTSAALNPAKTPDQKAQMIKAEYERLLDDAEARYDDAKTQLEYQQEAFERATLSFQEKHATLAQFVHQPMFNDDIVFTADGTYKSGEVLMSPVARDLSPREPRKQSIEPTKFDTGTTLDHSFLNLDSNQNDLLMSAEVSMLDKIEKNRYVIEATSLSVDSVIGGGLFGEGGPLLPDTENGDQTSNIADGSRIADIRARTHEAQQLDDAINAMPLGNPVDAEHYKTSRFGIRKDPFTRRPAMHSALDIASYRMAPIVATADGTVTFVGRKGTYGKLVVLDHGHGFKTRYAHLAKTNVKRGQKVKQGEKLGGMGSTGRSTSTHLHYEIRFQGRNIDPEKFLKAGRYVQQN